MGDALSPIISGSGGGAAATNVAAVVRRTTNQTVANNTGTPLVYDTVDIDTAGMWTVANPSRLTCKKAGVYLVWGATFWAVDSTSTYRTAVIVLNGDGTNLELGEHLHPNAANNAAAQTVQSLTKLALNDYVELWAYQGSGGNLDILAGTKLHEGAALGACYLAAG